MRIDRLVFGPGDRVMGWAWIRETGDGVWFDPPQAVPLTFSGWPPPLSRYAVRLENADLRAVATGLGDDGSMPAWASVTGIWLGDRIRVEEQSPVPPPERHRRAWRPPFTQPPCPPPAGGWPPAVNGPQPDNLTYDLADLESTGAAVTVAQFQPGPDRKVLVVAAADEGAVERRLRPQLGARLCVVPSRWTRPQLDATAAVLQENRYAWRLHVSGVSLGEDGQAYVGATMVRVLPEVADWAITLPDALLQVSPVLTPVQ